MNERLGALKYIFLYMCSFLWTLALLSIVMFQSPSFFGPFLSVLTFILVANLSLTKCIECRQKAKASGASLPWWKEWNNILFVVGFAMGVVGYIINWRIGINFYTVWVFLVGLVLVGFSAIWPIKPGSEVHSVEKIRGALNMPTQDFLDKYRERLLADEVDCLDKAQEEKRDV